MASLEKYKLSKRIILSYDSGTYDDGEIDYTYIVHGEMNKEGTMMAFCLSTGYLRILRASDYSNVASINLEKTNVLAAHFIECNSSLILVTYRNAIVDIFDIASGEKRVSYRIAGEINASTLLCGGKMLVTGDKASIHFIDTERGTRIGVYSDVHSDVVNNLVRHPLYPTVFASGSEDGLIYMYDVARGSQDDSILAIMQTDSGIQSIGWCGERYEYIWCCSMTRGLSIWNTTTGDRMISIADLNSLHNAIDYSSVCFTLHGTNRLYALCGNSEGVCYVVDVNSPSAIVAEWRGHKSEVRGVLENKQDVVSFGEDGSVCVWSPSSGEMNENVLRSMNKKSRKEEKHGKNAYKSL